MAAVSKSARKMLRVIGGILELMLNLLFYALVVIALVRLSATAYELAYQVFGNVTAEAAPGKDKTVSIDKGDSTMKVAAKLEEEGIVVSRYSFFLRAKLTISDAHPIMPGTYRLNSSMPYETILEVITRMETDETGAGENGAGG